MTRGWPCRFGIALVSLMACLPCASNAQAGILWVDWLASPQPLLRVEGEAGLVRVTVTGPLDPAPLVGVPGESNYWAFAPASYSAPLAGVPNAPASSDMLRVTGPGVYTITFSQPVTNPVLAIASLGGPPTPTTFDFGSQPIVLVSQGPGFWGAGSLTHIGNVVEGREGNGLIRLSGTMTATTFTMPTGEFWTGFTVGIDDTTLHIPAPPSPATTVGALLTWEYAIDPEAVATEFRLYRAVGAACADPALLMDAVAFPLADVRRYEDLTIPASTGPLCYEITAANAAGESAHSERAIATVEAVIPAVPGPITVQALVE